MRAIALICVGIATAVPAYALTFQSDTTAPAPPSADTAPSAAADQRVVCRRVDVTGSLIKRGRVCRTVAEWRVITENGNYNARKMVEEGTTRPKGD